MMVRNARGQLTRTSSRLGSPLLPTLCTPVPPIMVVPNNLRPGDLPSFPGHLNTTYSNFKVFGRTNERRERGRCTHDRACRSATAGARAHLPELLHSQSGLHKCAEWRAIVGKRRALELLG